MNILRADFVAIVVFSTTFCKMAQNQKIQPDDRSAAKAYLDAQIPPCSMLHQNLALSGDVTDRPYMPYAQGRG